MSFISTNPAALWIFWSRFGSVSLALGSGFPLLLVLSGLRSSSVAYKQTFSIFFGPVQQPPFPQFYFFRAGQELDGLVFIRDLHIQTCKILNHLHESIQPSMDPLGLA